MLSAQAPASPTSILYLSKRVVDSILPMLCFFQADERGEEDSGGGDPLSKGAVGNKGWRNYLEEIYFVAETIITKPGPNF